MEEHDVVVVGAGPSGSVAALTAKRCGMDVLLLDRSSFPRDKVCGDGITAQSLDLIDSLAAGEVTDGYPPVTSLHLVSPGGEELIRPLARPSYTVPRYVFDNRLLAMSLDSGVKFRQHRVRQITIRRERVDLDGAISARVVIGADGAYSIVRRALGIGVNPAQHTAIAIRGYAPVPPDQLMQHIIMSQAGWPAYAWSFPMGNGLANIGYGESLGGAPITRAHLIGRLKAMLPGVDASAISDLRSHLLPLATWRPTPGVGRMMLTGDACSLINPLSGEGIYYAVLSGQLAGAAAASAIAQTGGSTSADLYAQALNQALGTHLRSISRSILFVRQGWLMDGAVKAAADSQRVFDNMLNLTLGGGILGPVTATRILVSAAGVRLRARRL